MVFVSVCRLCSPAGGDLLYDDKLPEQGRNFANKIWNAFRLVKQWKVSNEIEQPASAVKAIEWFNHKLLEVIETLDKQFTDFRISEAVMTVYTFFWNEFSAWYLEHRYKPAYQNPIDAKTYGSQPSIFVDQDTSVSYIRLCHSLPKKSGNYLGRQNNRRKGPWSGRPQKWPKGPPRITGSEKLYLREFAETRLKSNLIFRGPLRGSLASRGHRRHITYPPIGRGPTGATREGNTATQSVPIPMGGRQFFKKQGRGVPRNGMAWDT